MGDTKKLLSVLSLCSGYGGLELGLERVFGEVSVLAHVEIEAFAVTNLVNKMETGQLVPAPIWTDLKTLPLEPFRDKIEVLTGGYPCQPFSAAGKRLGEDDPRHLWPHITRVIRGCRPTWCFFENVEGHISLGLSTVISDLEEMGYTATWGVFSAEEVGAPHQRKRVFILANGLSEGPQGRVHGGQDQERESEHGHTRRGRTSLHPQWPARPGEPQHEWEEPRVVEQKLNYRWVEQLMGLEVDWTALGEDLCPEGARVDSLRLLGNGVVPQTAERAFRMLMARFLEMRKWA